MGMRVFEHFRWLIAEWCDYKDPNTTKDAKANKYDLRKDLPPFPYRPTGWKEDVVFTRADFDGMSIEA